MEEAEEEEVEMKGRPERAAELVLERPLLMGIMSFYLRPLSLPAMLSAPWPSTENVCV